MEIITIVALIFSTFSSLGLYIQIKIQSRTIDLLDAKQELDYKDIKRLEHRISVLETINENKE